MSLNALPKSLEHIDVSDIKLASPLDRLLAFIVDSFILTMIACIMAFFLSLVVRLSDKSDDDIFIILMMLLMFFSNIALYFVYPAYYLSRKGATPGKQLFNLKVVDANSYQYLSYARAGFRDNIGKFFCILTLGIGYLMILFRKDRKGLHDVMFQTLVIVRKD